MPRPNRHDSSPEITFESGTADLALGDDEVFTEEEIPTQRFNEALRSVLQDEQKLYQDEPTRSTSHFELLREALQKAEIDQLKQMLQMINLLFLDDHIDPGDLAFDMEQISKWLESNDSDDTINITLSDESYLRITMVGSKKKNGEPSFFFSNPHIQKQFEVLSMN